MKLGRQAVFRDLSSILDRPLQGIALTRSLLPFRHFDF